MAGDLRLIDLQDYTLWELLPATVDERRPTQAQVLTLVVRVHAPLEQKHCNTFQSHAPIEAVRKAQLHPVQIH